MGKLTEDEIRRIVKRASIFQKFYEQAPPRADNPLPEEDQTLYEIADSLNIDRHFVKEALIEHKGIALDDPIRIDTNSNHKVEIRAHANGALDGSLVNELKAQLEYHFNTIGAVSRRKNRIFWKAKPAGPSKFLATASSPELILEESNGRVKLTLKQSLKTLNKLLLPAFAAAFGGFMMISGGLFGSGNDSEPLIIVGSMFVAGAFLFSRFVKGRKNKRKEKLMELTEVLQQTLERRFRAGIPKEEKKKETISIPDLADIEIEDEIEITPQKKVNS
ncbi:MAG: hypothetical protein RLN81_02235 [Balneolaceae bacterium]